MINSKNFCATASKNTTNDAILKFMFYFQPLGCVFAGFSFFRNLGGGLGCGKALHRLPMRLALNELLHLCKADTRFFHKSVYFKKVNNCTYVMTFASSMKSSSDMAPSFIILTATGVCCHQPCLTVCCMKNEYLSIISYSIFTALTKLPY